MAFFIINLIFISIFTNIPKSPKDFVWENRILIYQNQGEDLGWFKDNLKQAIKDRKLLTFEFEKDRLINTNCECDINSRDFLAKLESKSSKSKQWVLIGLDGGIKNSGQINSLPLEIFKIIDAMPMRQSEIKKSGQ